MSPNPSCIHSSLISETLFLRFQELSIVSYPFKLRYLIKYRSFKIGFLSSITDIQLSRNLRKQRFWSCINHILCFLRSIFSLCHRFCKRIISFSIASINAKSWRGAYLATSVKATDSSPSYDIDIIEKSYLMHNDRLL